MKHFRDLRSGLRIKSLSVTGKKPKKAHDPSKSPLLHGTDLCGVGDGNLNLHARLDVDGGDLLDDLRGRVEVDDTLVDPHLELVPGLGTLTARSLPGGDPEGLGGHPHGALHLQLLVLGTPDQVLADLLQGLHVPGGEGDPDPVDWRLLLNSLSILAH